MIKGLVAGAVNLALALAAGRRAARRRHVAGRRRWSASSATGSAWCCSCWRCAISAPRGPAPTSRLAPFIGAVLAVAVARRAAVRRSCWSPARLMALGLWLHLAERHEHEHVHEALEHEHRHVHDEHHQHAHGPGDPTGEPHTHWHRHAPLRAQAPALSRPASPARAPLRLTAGIDRPPIYDRIIYPKT